MALKKISEASETIIKGVVGGQGENCMVDGVYCYSYSYPVTYCLPPDSIGNQYCYTVTATETVCEPIIVCW